MHVIGSIVSPVTRDATNLQINLDLGPNLWHVDVILEFKFEFAKKYIHCSPSRSFAAISLNPHSNPNIGNQIQTIL
jgi:hypothetical protein